MKLMIDPPRGWMYGYPDVWDDEAETLSNNLKRHYYPEDQIESACQCLRMWEAGDED